MRRVAILFAVAALLIVAAVPAFAAPGGVPGPPADHVKGADDVEAADGGEDTDGPPEWAKAYGWRIKNEFGLPYGHLLKCGGEVETLPFDALLCPVEPLEIPEDTLGASSFWIWYADMSEADTALLAG